MKTPRILALSLLIVGVGCSSGGQPDCDCAALRADLEAARSELAACQTTAVGEATDDDPSDGIAAEEAAALPPSESDEDAPLIPVRSRVNINSATTSEIRITVRNDSDKPIDSFRFSAQCFNNFNERILSRRRDGASVFRGVSSDRVRPGQTRSLGTWSMFDFNGCTKSIVTITDVHFTDNTTWSGSVTQAEDPREAQEAPRPPTRRDQQRAAMAEGDDYVDMLLGR